MSNVRRQPDTSTSETAPPTIPNLKIKCEQTNPLDLSLILMSIQQINNLQPIATAGSQPKTNPLYPSFVPVRDYTRLKPCRN